MINMSGTAGKLTSDSEIAFLCMIFKQINKFSQGMMKMPVQHESVLLFQVIDNIYCPTLITLLSNLSDPCHNQSTIASDLIGILIKNRTRWSCGVKA